MALTITSLSETKIRRRRYYTVTVYGTDFPIAADPTFSISITSGKTGEVATAYGYTLSLATQFTVSGALPKRSPNSWYDVTVNLGLETSTLQNAFRVTK